MPRRRPIVYPACNAGKLKTSPLLKLKPKPKPEPKPNPKSPKWDCHGPLSACVSL